MGSWKRVRLSSSDVRGAAEAGGGCSSPFPGPGFRRQMAAALSGVELNLKGICHKKELIS